MKKLIVAGFLLCSSSAMALRPFPISPPRPIVVPKPVYIPPRALPPKQVPWPAPVPVIPAASN